jgi:hypothetical protein
LQSLSEALEKVLKAAKAGLQFETDDVLWPGKLTVYALNDRAQYRSFIRVVEKRSPDEAEQGSASLKSDPPHIAVGPGRTSSPTLESRAGHEVASAVLAQRAKAVPLPEWVVVGFGRAASAHASGHTAGVRKKGPRDLLRARLRPRDAWNDAVPYEQRMALAGGVLDFLVFGGGATKPVDFLNGFRPDDEKPNKTTDDALAAIPMTVDQFEAAFVRWLQSAR